MRDLVAVDDLTLDPVTFDPPSNMYMEACQIFLCPSFSLEQVTQYKKIIRLAGGIHVPEYDQREVTHIVVPSNKMQTRYAHIFEPDVTCYLCLLRPFVDHCSLDMLFLLVRWLYSTRVRSYHLLFTNIGSVSQTGRVSLPQSQNTSFPSPRVQRMDSQSQYGWRVPPPGHWMRQSRRRTKIGRPPEQRPFVPDHISNPPLFTDPTI